MPKNPRKPPSSDATAQALGVQPVSEIKSFLLAVRDLSIALVIMLVGLALCSITDHQGRIGQNDPMIVSQRVVNGQLVFEVRK